jgi:hypothetical protein
MKRPLAANPPAVRTPAYQTPLRGLKIRQRSSEPEPVEEQRAWVSVGLPPRTT